MSNSLFRSEWCQATQKRGTTCSRVSSQSINPFESSPHSQIYRVSLFFFFKYIFFLVTFSLITYMYHGDGVCERYNVEQTQCNNCPSSTAKTDSATTGDPDGTRCHCEQQVKKRRGGQRMGMKKRVSKRIIEYIVIDFQLRGPMRVISTVSTIHSGFSCTIFR